MPEVRDAITIKARRVLVGNEPVPVMDGVPPAEAVAVCIAPVLRPDRVKTEWGGTHEVWTVRSHSRRSPMALCRIRDARGPEISIRSVPIRSAIRGTTGGASSL